MTEPTRSTRPRRTAQDRTMRGNRIFARLLEGQSYQAIADAEELSVRRVRMIVQEALDRWDIEPRKEYTLVQIARLENALRLIERKIADGALSAVPHLVKLIEQLDRYHSAQFYAAPLDCADEHRTIAVRLKLERLAASRAAVSSRQPIPAMAGERPPRKESVG
jgi:hypothetical protein